MPAKPALSVETARLKALKRVRAAAQRRLFAKLKRNGFARLEACQKARRA